MASGAAPFLPRALPLTEMIGALRRLVATWRYAEAGRRDLRLDLLRGYCVLAMTVDHLDAPTWLYLFTGGNRFFVSAAEGFLFISGAVMGIVYRPIAEKSGLRAAVLKALRRALFLYLVTVGATLGFMWLSARLGLPWATGVDLREAWPYVVSLRRTFYLTDVLLLYTVLVGLAPIAFFLLRRGLTPVLVALSWGVWLAHQIRPIDLPWPSEEGAFFYIAAWQAVFFTALAIGWHRRALTARFGHLVSWWALVASAIGFGILLLAFRYGAYWLTRFQEDGGQALADAFAKWNLPPGRMLACATVFALAYLIATYFWHPVRATLGRLLMPLGQSALTAYVIQLAVVALLSDYRQEIPRVDVTNAVRGSLFQLFAVFLVWIGVLSWDAFKHGVVRRSSERVLVRRVEPAFAATLGLGLITAIMIAPLPAAPISGLVPVRDDRNTIDEPHYALHVPPRAVQQQPLPVLLVLHDANEDAELFGDELIELADREGWLLVAPRLAYESDHTDPDVIAVEAPSLIRGLRDVLAELPSSTGLRLRRRVMIFGYGRGAALAERYAFARPSDVRGVALLAGANYTLPPSPTYDDPPFPFGTLGFPTRRQSGMDVEAIRRIVFWVGVGENDTDQTTTSRAWDQYLGVTRVERARTLADSLRGIGVDTQLVVFPGAGHRISPQMRQAVADFSARVRAMPARAPPREPPGRETQPARPSVDGP